MNIIYIYSMYIYIYTDIHIMFTLLIYTCKYLVSRNILQILEHIYNHIYNVDKQTDTWYVDGWIDIFSQAVISSFSIFVQNFQGVKVQILREIPSKSWFLQCAESMTNLAVGSARSFRFNHRMNLIAITYPLVIQIARNMAHIDRKIRDTSPIFTY